MKNLLFSLSMTEKSLIEELWDYFVENYLENRVVYSNLGMEGSTMASVPLILAGLCIGVFLTVIAVMYDSRAIGGYVREMLARGFVGKENAVGLYELGVSEKSSFAKALRRSVGLRRVVVCVEEEEFLEKKRNGEIAPTEEYKHSGDEHYYIPEDKRITAEFRYIERGVKFWTLPIIFVLLVICYFILLFVVPQMFSMLDAYIGSFNLS